MAFDKKQCSYTSLFIIFCIIASCLNIHSTTITTFSDHYSGSEFPQAIYTTSAISTSEDACTPEMLGRQELNSRPEIFHKNYSLSNTYRILLYTINTIDTIHIALCHSLFEYISNSCEPVSTAFIISYIHLQDGKK